jgi:hypothetical protein
VSDCEEEDLSEAESRGPAWFHRYYVQPVQTEPRGRDFYDQEDVEFEVSLIDAWNREPRYYVFRRSAQRSARFFEHLTPLHFYVRRIGEGIQSWPSEFD